MLNSLHNPDNNVRAAGLDTLRKVKGVEQRPELRAAMEQLQNDNNPRLKLIAASVLQGNISVSNSVVGAINTGNVQRIDVAIEKIKQVGAEGAKFAEALRQFTSP